MQQKEDKKIKETTWGEKNTALKRSGRRSDGCWGVVQKKKREMKKKKRREGGKRVSKMRNKEG